MSKPRILLDARLFASVEKRRAPCGTTVFTQEALPAGSIMQNAHQYNARVAKNCAEIPSASRAPSGAGFHALIRVTRALTGLSSPDTKPIRSDYRSTNALRSKASVR